MKAVSTMTVPCPPQVGWLSIGGVPPTTRAEVWSVRFEPSPWRAPEIFNKVDMETTELEFEIVSDPGRVTLPEKMRVVEVRLTEQVD